MKIQLIFLFLAGIGSANATLICVELPEERIVLSDKKIIPYKTRTGYQYILEGPKDYRGNSYKLATVLVGELNQPELLFFPNFEAEDGMRSGVFYSNSILQNASFIISYGRTCGGEGYELHFKFSEITNEDL